MDLAILNENLNLISTAITVTLAQTFHGESVSDEILNAITDTYTTGIAHYFKLETRRDFNMGEELVPISILAKVNSDIVALVRAAGLI